jgi:hypothetical protein
MRRTPIPTGSCKIPFTHVRWEFEWVVYEKESEVKNDEKNKLTTHSSAQYVATAQRRQVSRQRIKPLEYGMVNVEFAMNKNRAHTCGTIGIRQRIHLKRKEVRDED